VGKGDYNQRAMHDIDDTTRKEVLGEVIMDELKAIREYVEDVPKIKAQAHQTNTTVNEINDRLVVIESVLRDHEAEIRNLKHKPA
jgi:hypothetical protein